MAEGVKRASVQPAAAVWGSKTSRGVAQASSSSWRCEGSRNLNLTTLTSFTFETHQPTPGFYPPTGSCPTLQPNSLESRPSVLKASGLKAFSHTAFVRWICANEPRCVDSELAPTSSFVRPTSEFMQEQMLFGYHCGIFTLEG